MRSRRDANGPWWADLVVDVPQDQIAVENLNSTVAAIGDIDIAAGVGRNRVRRIELIRLISARSNRLDKSPVLVVLYNPRIAVAVGDVDISCGVPSHIGWPVENIQIGRASCRERG